MKKLHAAIGIFLLLTTIVATSAQCGEPVLGGRVVPVADSLYLWAMFAATSTPDAPLWVCLPQMAHTMESYAPLAKACKARISLDRTVHMRPSILALDLRGHGKSVRRGKDTLSFQSLSNEEFAKYPADVEEVMHSFMADTVFRRDTNNVTVIGASIGANTAALVTEKKPSIKRIVLLSPGLDYKGLKPAEAVKNFRGEILLVSTKGDEYSYQAVQELHKLNPEHSTLLLYDGSDHGTDIINNNPAAMKDVMDWLLGETAKRSQ